MSFHKQIVKIHNTGLARTIVVCGNVYDLFYTGEKYLPLIPFLQEKTPGPMKLVYELNGPIRMNAEDKAKIKNAWISWKAGEDINSLILKDLAKINQKSKLETYGTEFETNFNDSIGNATCALEFMRQISIVSRNLLPKDSIIFIIEAADMLVPAGNGDIASLNDKQLHRISIIQDWICEPSFINGLDTLILVAESRSLIHPRISKLPHVVAVEVPSPDLETRKRLLASHAPKLAEEFGELTAGLSLHAINQLLKTVDAGEVLNKSLVINKVEEYIQSQLGEDVIEFKKPSHTLDDCVGFALLKNFLKTEFIPRIKDATNALSGAAVAGAIGGGKTYIFEAVAGECDIPVLVLKSIRSQWFGQTDVIFERLRRTLEALDRVMIFVDEADTQFGAIGAGAHETEQRLTGKIQAMMSDPKLKGKVFWLLMTARIHLLSPDIRRPGRAGDLIIPVLDPEGEDRLDFIKWVLKSITINNYTEDEESLVRRINLVLAKDYSSASFASLRSNLKYKKVFENEAKLFAEIKDFIQPAIGLTRKYQTLQALANTTRLSLLPFINGGEVSDSERESWEVEIRKLEAIGIK